MFKEASTSQLTQSDDPSIEDGFFSWYRWCLDPYLTFADLWVHLKEVSEQLRDAGILWQQEESWILGSSFLAIPAS